MIADWTHNGKKFTQAPEDYHGFIYLITFEDGSKYIGKKNFYSKTKIKIGKRELEREGKGKYRKYKSKNKEWVYYKECVKDSDWKTYCGSSDRVKYKLKNKENVVKREILHLAKDKTDLTYLEAKEQFVNEVLEHEHFINDNILGKFYKRVNKSKF